MDSNIAFVIKCGCFE